MINVLLTGIVAFTITFVAIPAIMRVAVQKKLFDIPDDRKLHTKPIASLGGVALFLGLFISTLLSISYKESPEFQYFLASAIVIFFLGLKDDILIISATKKFVGQLAATAILVHLGDIRINSMHGFLGVYDLPEMFSLVLSYTTIIVTINAFNLIDGVDGLAGCLGVLSTALFGVYFMLAGMPAYAMLGFSMTACLIAFLLFNYQPAKIFMGDSGSLLLGLVNAILVVKFINVADAVDGNFPITASVAIGFSILIVPLLDTLRVFSIRIYKGRSPFAPDRNHIHHLLLDRGLSHSAVTLSCVGLNLSMIGMAYFGRSMGSTVLLSLMLFAWFGAVGALIYFWKPVPKLVVAKSFVSKSEPVIQSATKVVSINPEAAVVEQ
jgi:UDP-N-acetylmuramyl pentapeptide phosphotransferase/UDP-N-acetylglucosamine-1-phosphate transferase